MFVFFVFLVDVLCEMTRYFDVIKALIYPSSLPIPLFQRGGSRRLTGCLAEGDDFLTSELPPLQEGGIAGGYTSHSVALIFSPP